jgi:hypothetical protein
MRADFCVACAALVSALAPAAWGAQPVSSGECKLFVDIVRSDRHGGELSAHPLRSIVSGGRALDIMPEQLSSESERRLLARQKSMAPQRPIDCGAAFAGAGLKIVIANPSGESGKPTPNVTFSRATLSANGKSALFGYSYWGGMLAAGCFGIFATRGPDEHWTMEKEVAICPPA